MDPVAVTQLHGIQRLRPSTAGLETRLRLLELMMDARLASSGAGGEAVAVGAGAALEPGDRLCAPRRYLGAHLAAVSPEGSPSHAGQASPAPDLLAIAAGMALAPRRTAGAVVTIVSDDALGTQSWREALRLLRENQAPLVVVVDGAVSASRPLSDTPPTTLPPTAEAVDGAELEDVLEATGAACERARGGAGPAAVQCVRRRAPLSEPFGARVDPIERYARTLLGAGAPRERIEAALR
jgi:TPP-dependent pyruvate/acetoin dehydrogenase alpha subunit